MNRKLEWDSAFWGYGVGLVDDLDDYKLWAIDNDIELLYRLVPADRPELVRATEIAGFRFTDVRVTLERRTAPIAGGSRMALAEDLAVLREIAGTAHRITRFYADPNLNNDRCDDLYREWMRNAFCGEANVVLVSERGGEPVGYVTVHLEDEMCSKIGLIAVAEDRRGVGIGLELVNSAIDWANSRGAMSMSVVTQGRNIAAQGLFQRAGFTTSDTSIWFHEWVT